MRVLLLEPGGAGGICHYSFNLAGALYQRGCRVTVVTRTPYELRDMGHTHDVQEFRLKSLRGAVKSLCYLWRESPNVIHYQGANNHPLFELVYISLVRCLSRAVLVYTGHQLIPHEGERRPRPLIRLKLMLCDAVIVHNRRTQAQAITAYSLHRERVHVVPHGNYNFLREIGPGGSPFGWEKVPGCIDVLFFGIIRSYKGLSCLIEAIAKLHREGKPFRLLVVGKPIEPWGTYQQLLERTGIAKVSLIRLGYLELTAIPAVFRFCNIVCLPYHRMSESGVLQIAAAFNKPVVATDVGGNNESSLEGLIAELVPAGDPTSLARALERVGSKSLESKQPFCGEVDRAPRSWVAIAQKTALLYDRVLSECRGA